MPTSTTNRTTHYNFTEYRGFNGNGKIISVDARRCCTKIMRSLFQPNIAMACATDILGIKYPKAMCLAIPVRVISVEGNDAEVEIAGVKRWSNITFTPEVKPGDYVLLHAGYAIGTVDEKEAEETLKLLEEIATSCEIH